MPVSLLTSALRAELSHREHGEFHLSLAFRSDLAGEIDAEVELSVRAENFESDLRCDRVCRFHLTPGISSCVARAGIDHPALWETWDRGGARLYRVSWRVSAGGERIGECSETTGFRSLRIGPDWRWELNGRPFFVRGVNLFCSAKAATAGHRVPAVQDVDRLLDANVNVVRSTGGAGVDFLEACDRSGILVWYDLEPPGDSGVWAESGPKVGENIRALARHPSIALWCVHPLGAGLEGSAWAERLLAVVRNAEAARPVLLSSSLPEHPMPGWDLDDFRGYDKQPGAPLVSRFGAQAVPVRQALNDLLGRREIAWPPPDWKEWSRLGFAWEETLHVARVEVGDSLDAFIAHSQDYQAELLKFAIEHYRLAKHRGVEGIFQYFFRDAGPAISFSVIDVSGRPKLGYRALKLGYQPILPIFLLHRRRAYSGGRLLGQLAVVNDEPEGLEGAYAEITLEVEKGTLISWRAELVTIPAFGVVSDAIRSVTQDFRLPSNMTLGPGRLSIRLFDAAGRRIAENVEAMEVVPPPPVL